LEEILAGFLENSLEMCYIILEILLKILLREYLNLWYRTEIKELKHL